MKWTFVIQMLALLTASTGIVTGDFWDDLADTVQDIVDDNVGEDTGIDLDAGEDILEDILDEARDFLDDTILPGGNIGGDENSVFGEGFTPVEAETSNKDDDLEALLDQLQGIADRIGELLVADGTFSQNDIREIVDAFDSRKEEDEVSEVLLTAILEYILEDLGVDVSDDLVEEKLVPLIIDVYNIVKDYISNATSSGNTKELQLLEDVLDSLVDNMFPNMTMEDIFCNAASNGIENFVEQSTNLERDNQKTFVRNVALLLLGCQEEEIKRINPDEGGRLRDIFMASSNGSLIEQVLEMLSTEPARNILTETFSSLLADRSTNFTLFNNPFLSAMIDSRPFSPNIFNNGSRNRRDQSRFGDVLENFGNFENLRDLFESLGEKRDSVDDQTPTTFIPNTSSKEDKSSTARPTVTTTTTAKTITRLLSSSTTSTVTATATTTAKTARTTTVQPNITATTATTSPGSFPFMMRRQRFREFRSNFREAVSNATERLAQLVREEINNSQLAQLIYTLLNSDLVREVLQALDISFIPLQTTSMTITTPKRDAVPRNSTGVFSTNDADIDRLPSDSEPVARAMTQTTIQILQTANLSDPESIVSTAGQVLLDNARQTLQDEVLSDPLAFVRDVVDFVSRNNSLLSRIIPQETMAAITDGIGPALQATQFASTLAQIYSTSGGYGTSQRCTNERAAVGEGITQVELWALAFVDTMGKPGTGVLEGNTWLEGNYDQCKAIQGTTDSGDTIHGQYVKMRFRLQIPGLTESDSAALTDQDTGLPNILWHVCLPKGCNSEDVTKIGEKIAESAGSAIESVEATILEKRDPSSETAFILAV